MGWDRVMSSAQSQDYDLAFITHPSKDGWSVCLGGRLAHVVQWELDGLWKGQLRWQKVEVLSVNGNLTEVNISYLPDKF